MCNFFVGGEGRECQIRREEWSVCFSSLLLLRPETLMQKKSWMLLLNCHSTQPPTVACKMKALSEYVHVAYMSLHVWTAICYASSVLIDKIFCIGAQSEVY